MGNDSVRSICFTINNPTKIKKEEWNWPDSVRYVVWQLEKGESGTTHIQGYIEFIKTMSFKAIKEILGQNTHIEKRRGSRDQARKYCMKEDSRIDGPWEYGEWISGPGHRTDIEIVLESLKEGKTEKEICEEHPVEWAKNYKVIDRYNLLNSHKRDRKTAFHVLIGDPGTGKSKTVSELSPNGYWKPPGQWFDGFTGKEDLILDEIDKQNLPIGLVLLLADRYPCRVAVKGSHVNFNAERIFATSNLPVEEWFPVAKDIEMKALLRRIDTKTTFTWMEESGVRRVVERKEVYGVDFETRYNPEAEECRPLLLKESEIMAVDLKELENAQESTIPTPDSTQSTNQPTRSSKTRKLRSVRGSARTKKTKQ